MGVVIIVFVVIIIIINIIVIVNTLLLVQNLVLKLIKTKKQKNISYTQVKSYSYSLFRGVLRTLSNF